MSEYSWNFWFTLPIYPYGQRRTLRREVVRDRLWTFDQLQGIFYVVVPIRMTVVKLDAGGLLVYAPIAPTGECLRLLHELVADHGPVRYIIHPTVSGLEHKVFVGPFARACPQAQVYIAPQQWSFPLNLPLSWLGLPGDRTRVIPDEPSQLPFADQCALEVLGPINLGTGWFGEVALYDRPSRSLLLTDSLIAIPEDPPAIVQLDSFPLLFHAKDSPFDRVEDTPENRRKGWKRICLFASYFRPSVLETAPWGQVIRDAFKVGDRSRKNYFGLYPFQWTDDWQRSFEALRGNGRPLVAPVLQQLILNRAPQETLDWVERVSQWHCDRLISAHFQSPISITKEQFCQAFAFLKSQDLWTPAPLPNIDLQLLAEIDQVLCDRGIVPPSKLSR
ncbi:DUF4336 domain-containing protein [Phormidium yuhuli AB48]|uniref:DUF4336 domain-containing protein n=1 Tax=Phormidium yuhuli AB48 TaxID=2940671 RepID=A0ABY5AP88_9CYAN|nr:DUF4336 domain-containing protein [Phormidium yuhuli]USR90640.1 DUF4336 domain-containing protein [Phormidium yuhuli AB48]